MSTVAESPLDSADDTSWLDEFRKAAEGPHRDEAGNGPFSGGTRPVQNGTGSVRNGTGVVQNGNTIPNLRYENEIPSRMSAVPAEEDRPGASPAFLPVSPRKSNPVPDFLKVYRVKGEDYTASVVYSFRWYRSRGKYASVPSAEDVAAVVGKSRRTIYNVDRRLREAGLLDQENRLVKPAPAGALAKTRQNKVYSVRHHFHPELDLDSAGVLSLLIALKGKPFSKRWIERRFRLRHGRVGRMLASFADAGLCEVTTLGGESFERNLSVKALWTPAATRTTAETPETQYSKDSDEEYVYTKMRQRWQATRRQADRAVDLMRAKGLDWVSFDGVFVKLLHKAAERHNPQTHSHGSPVAYALWMLEREECKPARPCVMPLMRAG